MPQILIGLLIFISSPILFSTWIGHLITSIFAVLSIHKLAKYWFFWILLIIVTLTSSEPRFSLEYFLIASGLYALSLSKYWKNFKIEKKEIFFALLFLIFFLLDFFKIRLYEKGSFLLLLPFTLSLLFPLTKLAIKNPKSNARKLYLYTASFIAILLSNKRATLLAFITGLKNAFSKKILILVTVIFLGLSYLVKDNIVRHYEKSIEPRLHIWQSTAKGFLDKPIFGHGFGIFPLEFPPYRYHANTVGGQNTEYINHGHSQVFHTLFENGLLGMTLLIFLAIFIYKQSKLAFWTFLVTILLDMPLKSFGQFLLFGLIINSSFYKLTGLNEARFFTVIKPIPLSRLLEIVLTIVALVVFSISSLAHYHFDQKNLDLAIKIDPYNSLYHFERGASLINTDIEQSEKDLSKAIELSPGIGYFQAYYSAASLGNGKVKIARKHIDKALKQMGDDAYLHALASYAYYSDKEKSKDHMEKALLLDPDIEYLITDPSITASEFIASKHGNPRIMSFYRRGQRLYLPLPYIE